MAAKGMIRRAGAADLPALWELVEAYAAEIAPAGMQPQRAATLQTLGGLIQSPRGFVLVAGDAQGILAGHVSRSPWADVLVAQYLIFYLAPELRGGRAALRMLQAYEDAATAAGAQILGASETGERLERLLSRRGYLPTERTFLRAV